MAECLCEIIDIDELQELMHFFYEAVGVPVGILNSKQQWLVQIGWQSICTDFHRQQPLSRQDCLQSDSNIQQHLQTDKHLAYQCPHGLVEVAFPIVLDNQSLGTFFMGQFLNQSPDYDFFRRQAIHYGFKLDDYLAAVEQVPIISKERVEYLMRFFKRFLGLIIKIGEENKQRRLAESESGKPKNSWR